MEASAIVTATPKHIESVRKKIEEIRKSISSKFFDLGLILKEVRDGAFHMTWGHKNFGDWLEKSGLDLSERSSYYLMKIVEVAEALDIPREEIEKVKLSKLREIASLDTKKDGDKIKALIKACTPDENGEEMSLDDVKHNVAKVKAGDEAIDTFVFLTLKFTQTTKTEVIDPAIELARALHGDTLGPDGQPIDISPGRAIELILGDFLAGAETQAEKPAEEPLPVEGQKALPPSPEVFDVEVVDQSLVGTITVPEFSEFKDAEFLQVKTVEELAVALKSDNPDDDPLLSDVVNLLNEQPEATPNLVKIRFRTGELRAFNLYKEAKAVIDKA